MLRQPLLVLARSTRAKNLVTAMPLSSGIVSRYVPGETVASAIGATRELIADGLYVTLDFLGEDTLDREQADGTVAAYLELLSALSEANLARSSEVSLKLSAIGQALPGDGEKMALENARIVCHAARNAGTTVTLDAEDHTTTDSTLEILHDLRKDFPETGAVLQAYLHRTEADCRDLAYEGSRVRLCKGAYKEPESVAYQSRREVDLAYVRCLKILMAGEGYPMLATHDPTLIAIGRTVASNLGRSSDDFEFQMLYGIRPGEQKRLVGLGMRMRVYVPYGNDWYAYLVRRLAERPANLGFFLRSLVTKN